MYTLVQDLETASRGNASFPFNNISLQPITLPLLRKFDIYNLLNNFWNVNNIPNYLIL